MPSFAGSGKAIANWYLLTLKRSCGFVPGSGLCEAGDCSEHFVDWAFAHAPKGTARFTNLAATVGRTRRPVKGS